MLRAAVSIMEFERVSFRFVGSARYLYAKDNANSLGCSSCGGISSHGGGRCVHDYSSLSSWLHWENYTVGELRVSAVIATRVRNSA